MTTEINLFQKIVFGNFGIAVFILKKKFAVLKPMNIFQSNYFAVLGFISLTAMYVSDSPSKVG